MGGQTGNGYGLAGGLGGQFHVASSYTDASGNKPFAVTRYDVHGTVVQNFPQPSGNGTATISFGSGTAVPSDLLYVAGASGDPDALFVVGTYNDTWAVAKLNAFTGALDPAFGTGGKRSGFQAGKLNAADFQLLGEEGSGRLLLAGRDNDGNMAVYALDAATGSTVWHRIFNFGYGYVWQEAYDILEESGTIDNKVVVGGLACRGAPLGGGNDFALARFNANGTLDDGSASLPDVDTNPADSFGTGGKITTNFNITSGAYLTHGNSYDSAYSLVEAVDGNSIYAVGKTNHAAGPDRFAVVSYLKSDGSLDPNFRGPGMPNGLAIGPPGVAYDAAIQDNPRGAIVNGFGMITAGGAGTPGDTSSDFVLARFKTVQSGEAVGGSLDADFGSGGVARTDFAKNQSYSSGHDVCRRIRFSPLVDSTGNTTHSECIIGVGYSGATSTGGNIAMAEYLPRNRVHVFPGSSGGAPMMAAAPAHASSSPSSTDGLSSLLIFEEEDDETALLSG